MCAYQQGAEQSKINVSRRSINLPVPEKKRKNEDTSSDLFQLCPFVYSPPKNIARLKTRSRNVVRVAEKRQRAGTSGHGPESQATYRQIPRPKTTQLDVALTARSSC